MQSARPSRCWGELLLLRHRRISAERPSPRLRLARDGPRMRSGLLRMDSVISAVKISADFYFFGVLGGNSRTNDHETSAVWPLS